MKFLYYLSIFVILVFSFEIEVDYGVDPSQSGLYNKEYFECDQSTVPKRLDKSQINDDYCDCLDGTDEPGTSACNNMKFYCKNQGFHGHYIPSTKVNDNICDCCDGSDEYNSDVHCENTCKEQYEQWQKEHSQQIEREQKGQQILEQWSMKGMDEFISKKESYLQAKKDLEEFQQLYNKLNETYTQKLQSYLSSHSVMSISHPDLEALFNKAGLSSLTDQELRFIIIYMMNSLNLKEQDSHSNSNTNSINELLYEAISEVHKSNGSEDDQEVLTSEDFAPFLSKPESDPDLSQMNHELEDLRRSIEGKNLLIESLTNYFNQNHGYYYELDHYISQCYTHKVDKYTYKICPFKNAQQDSTSLGDHFQILRYDPSLSIDKTPSQVLPKDLHIFNRMVFSNGAKCWNGPERSITVDLVCDSETSLHTVTEPSMCVYQGIFHTPTACEPTEKMIERANELHKEEFKI